MLRLLKHAPNYYEYVIEGVAKRYGDWLSIGLLIVYSIAITFFSPPLNVLSFLLWLYCAIFVLLVIYSPKWWLWGAIITICILGFIPNLFGVFNKHVIDGSLLSITYLQQIQITGLKGRVASLPLIGLVPSLFVWWLKAQKVYVPSSFISICVFCMMMISSALYAIMKYVHVSLLPPDLTIIIPDIFDKMPYARQWWQSAMPYTLMLFTVTFTFASLVGVILILVVYNIIRKLDLFSVFFSALTIATLVAVIYGLAQQRGLVPVFTAGKSFESTFQSQGSYGVFVGISCVFFFNRLFLSEGGKVMYSVLFLISLLGIFLNQTRTALMALLINPFVIYAGYLLLRKKSILVVGKTTRKGILTVIAAVFISVFIISIPGVNKSLQQDYQNGFIQETIQIVDFNRSLDRISSGRIHIWAKCFDIWHDTPIWGCGQGQLYWELKARGIPDTAANQFILVLAEMGIVGFGIFLWAIFSIFRDLARPVFSEQGGYDYHSWLICCSLVICILVQSLTVHVLHFPNLPLLIGMIVGMALASSRPCTDTELSEDSMTG